MTVLDEYIFFFCVEEEVRQFLSPIKGMSPVYTLSFVFYIFFFFFGERSRDMCWYMEPIHNVGVSPTAAGIDYGPLGGQRKGALRTS